MSVLKAVQAKLDGLVHEIMKFGVVGAVAYIVDFGLFNLLLMLQDNKPLTAKTISVVAATIVAYLGNRYWAFRHRGGSGVARETFLFFAFNAAALVIALACLGGSRYVLGLEGALADNIAANVIGMGLGTLFRFWSYRKFVFPETTPVETPVLAPVALPVPAVAVAMAPSRLVRVRPGREPEPVAA